MNKIILMTGTIILTYFILLVITPSYKDYRIKSKYISSEEEYYHKNSIISMVLSIMINFLIWGWFL